MEEKEKLTWEKMKKKYPDQWLLIVDFDTDPSGHLTAGIVERHSPEMEDVAKLPSLNKPTAFRYTGTSTFMGLRSHVQNKNYL